MGDYSRRLDRYTNVSVSYDFVAGTDYSGGSVATKIAAVTGWTIYIQRILLAVTTDNAAVQTFQDSAGTPIIAAKSKISPGVGPILWDFGPEGFALTVSKGFQHLMSAAGMAGSVTVTAYMKRTATSTP